MIKRWTVVTVMTSLIQNAFLSRSSILGMNLFGCKFCQENQIIIGSTTIGSHSRRPGSQPVCHRKNFDSLLWAIITVFQVTGHFLNTQLSLTMTGEKRYKAVNSAFSESACTSVYICVWVLFKKFETWDNNLRCKRSNKLDLNFGVLIER